MNQMNKLRALIFILLVALCVASQTPNPQYGTGTIDSPDGQFHFIVPSGMYVKLENYTPTYTPTDWPSYQFCQYNHVTGFEHNPCYFLFPEVGKRWIVFRFCVSGQRPGTPAQCWCPRGYAGNSGKCK